MKRLLLLLALAVPACAKPPIPPPQLFPLRAAWTVEGEDEILPPLATDGARVFVASRGGGVRALDPGTGALVWRDPAREGRLAADTRALYVREPDGGVWRLDPDNGAPRWHAASGIAGEVAPVLGEGRLIVAGRGVAALDPLTGELLWSLPEAAETLLPPALGGGRVVLAESDGTLRCRDAAGGASLWTQAFPPPLLASPVIAGRRVFLGTTDRRFVALDLEKEGRQRWRWKLGADVEGPAAVLDDMVIFASIENVLYALASGSGNMVWRSPLPTRPLAGPQLLGSAVVVATREEILAGYNGNSGRQMGTLSLGAELVTTPVAVADLLIVGLRDRSVAAVTMSQPAPRPGEELAAP